MLSDPFSPLIVDSFLQFFQPYRFAGRYIGLDPFILHATTITAPSGSSASGSSQSQKRTHSEMSDDDEDDACNCSRCRHTPDLTHDESSSDDDSEDSYTEVLPDGELYVAPYIPPAVKRRASKLDAAEGEQKKKDDYLLSYTQETSAKPEEVLARLKEEDRERERLARPVLNDMCTATRKRARRS